jgi:hypothetical protein
VGYSEKKIVSHPEIVIRCIPQWRKTSSAVSHNEEKPSPTQEMLLYCIPQQQDNLKLKYINENKFFSKMIFTHESGSREDQFDEKKWK